MHLTSIILNFLFQHPKYPQWTVDYKAGPNDIMNEGYIWKPEFSLHY